jgi:hypothetical protein
MRTSVRIEGTKTVIRQERDVAPEGIYRNGTESKKTEHHLLIHIQYKVV